MLFRKRGILITGSIVIAVLLIVCFFIIYIPEGLTLSIKNPVVDIPKEYTVTIVSMDNKQTVCSGRELSMDTVKYHTAFESTGERHIVMTIDSQEVILVGYLDISETSVYIEVKIISFNEDTGKLIYRIKTRSFRGSHTEIESIQLT